MKSSVLASLSFVTSALAANRTTAPSGCITVATRGGQYSSIQSAVSSLDTSSSTAQCIFIDQGTYSEQVLVPARTAPLTIYGYTSDDSGYAGNGVTITASKSHADGLTNDETATLRVQANNFKLYNVNVANTHGKGSQAVALSVAANSGYYGCAFTGYQDTLLAESGTQVYAHSLIQGATDFIFGRNAPAWFEQCDLRVVTASQGYITASGRDSDSSPNYYVFNASNIAAATGATVADGAYYLGRPWGAYARVVFQGTSMSSVVNAAGWKIWNTGDERTDHVLFGEYGNSGKGSEGARARFATKLRAPVAIATVLGSDYASAAWYDAAHMS